ncbi:MAG: 3-oxoacyl-ACP synthase III [Candidatus Sumerlaeaceae bacterium]|nr:3-oxoacyl-ACP synthase III [Candidatus Sumerlaeaceae bacterium]
MRFNRVNIESFGYELAPNVVSSDMLEQRLAPVYTALGIASGQIVALTGVRERRYWHRGHMMWQGAAAAGRKALEAAGLSATEIDILIFASVCRDHLEPATACAVADALGVSGNTEIYDISNACLGVLNGMINVATAIESGRARTGLIVACETAREIVDITIERLCARPDMESFKKSLATMTGGSGAAAVLLRHAADSSTRRRLLGGVVRSAAEHHRLCRWGPPIGVSDAVPMEASTDAAAVLQNGVVLASLTWKAFLQEMGWDAATIDRTICHQVGEGHRFAFLQAVGMPPEKDYPSYGFLGNMGTVSLPLTAALADERGFLAPGQRVALLGIGSGLNCVMLGVEW